MEQTLREMLERDANDPELRRQRAEAEEQERQERIRIQRERDERTKLLYAVPNVPYREMQEKK